jgi:hypothetical protein
VASATHVNGTVLLVTLLSGLLIRRSLRRDTAGAATFTHASEIVSLRHAA